MLKTDIESGNSQSIEVANNIHIVKIAIYGADIKVVFKEILTRQCLLKFILMGDTVEEKEIRPIIELDPEQNYAEWKLCIMEMKNQIVFPTIGFGEEEAKAVKKIKIEFKTSNPILKASVFYINN